MTITNVLLGYTTSAATLSLVLSLLVLRSLHGGAPTMLGSGGAALPASGPEPGSPALRITAVTEEAKLLDTEQFSGQGYLLAFYSSTCLGCRTALPAMTGYAGELFGDPRQLITVIVGDRRRGADIAATLRGSATVVHEPDGGPISSAYRINLFPSYVLVSEAGIVLATGQSVRDLPQRQPQ
jgi:thiol-disulfide isomerase/thioredoxin